MMVVARQRWQSLNFTAIKTTFCYMLPIKLLEFLNSKVILKSKMKLKII